MKNQRRQFLKKVGGSLALAGFGGVLEAGADEDLNILRSEIKPSANDRIRIGLIGAGIIGHYDAEAALKIVGVELAAVCDLYTGRLEFAKEKWGKDMFTTRDYREVLDREDIDAVLICTPDHWHQRISIDALNAGKHVYCEKPMVHKIEEGKAIIDAQKESKKVFQVGSQRASALAILEAKKVLESGMIGELTYIQAYCDRTDFRGAWNYSIPLDASPETVDFDTFLGDTPKVPFDATRFFRWRNYKDYGTGAAGDLIVHLLTGIHTITESQGPTRIFSLGDLKYWQDGREAYDIVNALMDYPASEKHKSFQLYTRANLADGEGKGGFGMKMFGTEGVIDIGWHEFKVSTVKRGKAPGFGGYDAFESFSKAQKTEFQKWYKQTYGSEQSGYHIGRQKVYSAPIGYDDRMDHMVVFFNAVRNNNQVLEDASFGLRAAAPSLACNLSIEQGRQILWDPVEMKLV
ncbi:Predicted dehydrogenase [Aquiflexum balticum DSM 16537]|uniref:Predicted dehydrogenase n=1 Tax=Aquiflexum balticum DSM 16537 TaxID=758820 RepID=A0A1W2H822_9BACT|nr:Gfo/Idh/MocA family oxidoreductase [Aquiflexum balticum]SMD45040.1 Predicted dehydrogenase [Aquiflexum balticum DSM 16537]